MKEKKYYFLNTQMIGAIKCNNTDVLKACLSNGININDKIACYQQPPIVIACQVSNDKLLSCNKNTLDFLLSHSSCDINATCDNKNTALHYAAMNNDTEIIKKLLKYGADINTKDDESKTVLHLIMEYFDHITNTHQTLEILEMLCENCDKNIINANDIYNQTALDYAIETTQDAFINMLIKYGANTKPHIKPNTKEVIRRNIPFIKRR